MHYVFLAWPVKFEQLAISVLDDPSCILPLHHSLL